MAGGGLLLIDNLVLDLGVPHVGQPLAAAHPAPTRSMRPPVVLVVAPYGQQMLFPLNGTTIVMAVGGHII